MNHLYLINKEDRAKALWCGHTLLGQTRTPCAFSMLVPPFLSSTQPAGRKLEERLYKYNRRNSKNKLPSNNNHLLPFINWPISQQPFCKEVNVSSISIKRGRL